jgi:spore germination cell wall hydrolase CwlJ-like protein
MRLLPSVIVAAFIASPSLTLADDPIKCLAEALHHESRGEPLMGQLAVGIVARNRRDDSRWPSTICGVLRQGPMGTGNAGCQFSYYCDGSSEVTTPDALALAKLILDSNLEITGMEQITHYHSIAIRPKWLDKVTNPQQIGNHIFYTSKGDNDD